MNRWNQSAKSNRGRKLFLVFAQRHDLKGYNITQFESEFSEDSMKLVPRVMACINTYSADFPLKVCLWIYFKLVRDWVLPEMYQFYSMSADVTL